MDTSSFLKSISEGTEPGEILSKLHRVRTKIAKAKNKILSDEEISQVTEEVDNSIQSVIMLKNGLEKLNALVNLYQRQADQSIPDLKMLIDSTITNYRTAYDATESYDKNWFANSLFSEEGKVELADYLSHTIANYCIDNLDTLNMISNRDADMMNYIKFPKSDDRN